MDEKAKKIMEIKGSDGEQHPIYGDAYVAAVLADVLARLNDLEAKEAREKWHDA